jgi:RNA polymerase sigma factor (sigma-70 family)
VTGKQPFEAVVAAHGATVLRVCRTILGMVDADDAWSETFLAALKAYPNLPGDANVEAWLVTIARRKAIDATRATARREVPMADSPDVSSAHRADGRDLDLAAAIDELPPRQRDAVVCHHLAGMPYQDVASAIGGTADAARKAASDGIATLRRTYSGAEGGKGGVR